jgi:hypothetical protein
MTFAILEHHNAIGWDFDETLVRHPYSAAMHAYIKTHPEKRHVIVTFRTHGLQNRVFEELALYPDAPGPEAFDAVLNIADEAWAKFDAHRSARLRGEIGPELTEAETYYLEWKGATCREHGLTVLVDDMVDRVHEGCKKNGIVYVNPDDLTDQTRLTERYF